MMNLTNKRCVPCEGGARKLDLEEIAEYRDAVPDWRPEGDKLLRSVAFRDFRSVMAFLNRVAALAESEGHHPDFCVHYSRVDFAVWTHAVDGLSQNDFILAAKISQLIVEHAGHAVAGHEQVG